MRKTRFNGVISPATALDAANIQNRKVEPAVSVIIPIHNGAATIKRTLRSLLAQSLVNWEAIIIDDASSDEKIDGGGVPKWNARDGRFRVARLTENRGSAAARNAGLRMARGEFVAYLDDDDQRLPGLPPRCTGCATRPDVLVFGFDMLYEDGPRGDRPGSWDPTVVGHNLFSFNPGVPLSIQSIQGPEHSGSGFNHQL